MSALSRLRFAGVIALAALSGFADGQMVLSPVTAQVHTAGYVFAIARQSDGKVIIGGSFVSINGTPRNNIARLNADGTLDMTWDPNASADVSAVAVDSTSVYVGGDFYSIGGQPRHYLAKLAQSGVGAADPNWNPNPDNEVHALALNGTGDLYLGGLFTSIGGQPRNYLAKVSGSGIGAVDASWDPHPSDRIWTLVVDGSAVFVAGDFVSIGGQSRAYLAKLADSAGVADPTWNPDPNNFVDALALDGNGNLYVAGEFSSIGGRSRNSLAKISESGIGVADANWDPNVYGNVYAVATDGVDLYVGGNLNAVGGLARSYIAKVAGGGTGGVDPLWKPDSDNIVNALAASGSGNVYAGGQFMVVDGQTRLGLATLTGPTGSVASGGPAIPPWAVGTQLRPDVHAIAFDPAGRTVIGGAFQFVWDGTRRNNIARLNADGTVDSGWDPNPNGEVRGIAIDGNGDVIVGGGFSFIGGQRIPYLVKVPSAGNGAVDTTWAPEPDDVVWGIAVDGGSVYVGGDFKNIGGQSRNYIAKLPTTGTGDADPIWDPHPDNLPWVLAIQGSDLYAGGYFTSIGGQPRNYLAKLSTSGTGAADATWDPSPDRDIWAIAADGNGSVFAAGNFSTIGGEARLGLAKLSSTGTGVADALWDANQGLGVLALSLDGGSLYVGGFQGLRRVSSGTLAVPDTVWYTDPDGLVGALRVDPRGNVYAGGGFTNIAGQQRIGYAVLTPYALSLTSSIYNSSAGDSVFFFATLASPYPPSGTVTFKDAGATIAGCVAIAMPPNSQVACTSGALTAGTHVITAEYTNNPNDGVVAVAAFTQTVTKRPTSTALVSSNNPAAAGAAIAFTATVNGNNPSGSVTFAANGSAIPGCSGIPVAGSDNFFRTAQCTTSGLSTGTRSIVATFGGDALNATSASAPLLQVIDNANGSSVNVALASAGAVASASSTFSSAYPASAINNGDRAGVNFGAGGVWKDATSSAFPDWVEIDFIGPQIIDHVVVYTVQDNTSSPIDPSDKLTFTKRGLTGFDVQTWNGTAWTTQGSVTGNNLVKRTVSFAATTTSAIRVLTKAALGDKNIYSFVTEVEAWLVTAPPPPPPPGITLISSANPVVVGRSVTFTATVSGSSPSGAVSFTQNSGAIASCTAVALAGSGDTKTAQCLTTFPGGGTYAIVAKYGGDTNNPAHASAPLSEKVKKR